MYFNDCYAKDGVHKINLSSVRITATRQMLDMVSNM